MPCAARPARIWEEMNQVRDVAKSANCSVLVVRPGRFEEGADNGECSVAVLDR
jgi:hypothetical protein